MSASRGPGPPRTGGRLSLAGRTVRVRFTALYSSLFLLSGAALLAIVTVMVSSAGSVSSVAPAPVHQQFPPPAPNAQTRIHELQAQLAQAESTQMRNLLLASALALALMAVVSLVLGRIVAGRVLRPLRTMTAATKSISADNLHERLAVRGPQDEVKDLADTIDELLARLEGAFAAQRRFVANASHELRTPLATMRASLDVAVAKPAPIPPQTITLADRLRTELDHMDELLESLLALARAQHGVLPNSTTLSVGRLVTTALGDRSADISAKKLTVHTDIDLDDTQVEASRPLLRRMVDNVIDNAIAHNHRGGWIQITTTSPDHTVHLVVETGGQTLDQHQVAQLAQPFRRLGPDRTGPGAGLGLSIVASIVAAHGGTLDLRAREDGGLTVDVSLPRTTQPAASKAGAPA